MSGFMGAVQFLSLSPWNSLFLTFQTIQDCRPENLRSKWKKILLDFLLLVILFWTILFSNFIFFRICIHFREMFRLAFDRSTWQWWGVFVVIYGFFLRCVILERKNSWKEFCSRRILDLTEDVVFVVGQMSISFHFS